MDERLDLDEFEACAGAYDCCVAAQAGIDRFCSRSEWILPFHRTFLPERELHLYRRDGSFVALAAREHPTFGLYLESLENMWCFACPLVGPGSAELLADVARSLSESRLAGSPPVPLILSGLPLTGELPRSLIEALDPRYDVRAVDSTVRFVASLEGGIDGYLARRSSSLRRNLRSAERRARLEGVSFLALDVQSDRAGEVGRIYERILAIEGTSWKAHAGIGVDHGSMRAFYGDMLPRLAARGGLRVVIALQGERDVGYLHGGVIGTHFRGLQMSFDDRLSHLSLGNLLQFEMLRRLCEEGIETYDLGTRSAYKRHWAEEGLRTLTLLLRSNVT